MAQNKNDKFQVSLMHLEEALKEYRTVKTDSELPFLALSKAFEIAVEYAWRELKAQVEDDGLDAPSPKIAVKQAAKLGFIDNPEEWLNCINARNNSVHDYFGISEKDYVALAARFLILAQVIKK